MFRLASFNWLIFLPTLALLALSLLVVRSLNPEVFTSHFTSIGLGLVAFLIASLIDWQILKRFAFLFYLSAIFLLLLTLFLGITSRGASRWLDLGFTVFQPSELIKPGLIIFLSAYFSRFDKIKLSQALVSFLFLLPALFLIFLQPDLSSALIIFLLWLGLIFAAGLNWRFFALGLAFFLIVSPIAFQFLQPYQRQRVATFIDPTRDPLGSGYNVIQSVTAVGAGGLGGFGLGHGPQSHLRFLPEAHTDFVFASLAEELGFLGSVLILVLIFWLCFQLLRTAQKSQDNFKYLVSIGVFSLIFWQPLINIAMNLALLPVTGITLPLISFGGSSMISILASLGMLNSLAGFGGGNKVKYAL